MVDNKTRWIKVYIDWNSGIMAGKDDLIQDMRAEMRIESIALMKINTQDERLARMPSVFWQSE